jgi:mannose-1-phosphate guanylyltransferase
VKRAAVILAGGAGTRLRPLSSDACPKQFLRIFDGRSLIEMTFTRVSRLLDAESIFVSTNEQYRDLVHEHLPSMPEVNILTEPARRNTAPAIALCCFTIESRDQAGPTCIAILPSDHFIADEAEFVRVLDRAFAFAEQSSMLVTIGIEPTEPNTGYGYLDIGEVIDCDVARVERFVEKPDRAHAEEFLRAGNYTWNAGMFIWRSDAFRRELEAHAPEIVPVTRETYESMPSISIDYALMEKSSNVAAIRGDFGWSDVGSFEALAKVGAKFC